MRRSLIAVSSLALALGLGACDPDFLMQRGAEASLAGVRAEALVDPARPAADRERDASRHAAETLDFTRVQPGWKVADMVIGGGYFTRIFSAAVGPRGHVTAWQPAEFIGFSPDYAASIAAVDEIANVDSIRSPLAAPELPKGLDLAFTAQNYHDFHLQPFATTTAASINAAVFEALKPGGYYVIIDHHATAGSGLAAADTLHRIDIEAVNAEVLAAGFVLDGESDVLANADDPLTANVFDEAIRGRTSQFMLRFRKPG